jgi:hypoxia up-regulated 1
LFVQDLQGHRLSAFDDSDRTRRLREEALNALEAFTYRARDILSDDSFTEYFTEKERSDLRTRTEAANDWLNDEGAQADRDATKTRLKGLKDIVTKVEIRKEETKKRPAAIEKLQQALNSTKVVLEEMRENVQKAKEASESSASSASAASLDDSLEDGTSSTSTTSSSKPAPSYSRQYYDLDDVAMMLSVYDSADEWLTSCLEGFNGLTPQDDPPTLSKDIETKASELDKLVKGLLSKRLRIPPRPKNTNFAKSTKSKKSKKTTATATSSESSSTAKESTTMSAEAADETVIDLNEDAENLYGQTNEDILAAMEKVKQKIMEEQEKERTRAQHRTKDEL